VGTCERPAISPDGRTAWVTATTGLVRLTSPAATWEAAGGRPPACHHAWRHPCPRPGPAVLVPINLLTRPAESAIPAGGATLATTPSQAPMPPSRSAPARHPDAFTADRPCVRPCRPLPGDADRHPPRRHLRQHGVHRAHDAHNGGPSARHTHTLPIHQVVSETASVQPRASRVCSGRDRPSAKTPLGWTRVLHPTAPCPSPRCVIPPS